MEAYYSDEFVTLFHGDCLEISDWLDADSMVTDPPYGMSFSSGWGEPGRKIKGDSNTEIRDSALAAWGSVKPAAVFGTWRVERPGGVKNLVVWDKSPGIGPGMGDLASIFGNSHEEIYIFGRWLKGDKKRLPSVLSTSAGMGSLVRKVGHPTPKPLELMRTLVAAAPGELVADPFVGSGSTLVAAKQLGIRVIGVEFEEKYCELAAGRVSGCTVGDFELVA